VCNGFPVAQVRAVKVVGSSDMATIWVVAPGIAISGYKEINVGELVPADMSVTTVSSPAFFTVVIDQWLPKFDWEFYLCGFLWSIWYLVKHFVRWILFRFLFNNLRADSRLFLFFHRFWLSCIFTWAFPEDRFAKLTISFSALNFCYRERLNTMKALGSSTAKQLALSTLQRQYLNVLTMQTILTTEQYFSSAAAGEFVTGKSEHMNGCVLVDIGSVPSLFECPVAVVEVGKGWLDSTTIPIFPPVTDNGNLIFHKGEGMSVVDGVLTFEQEYERPIPIFFYGPHVASASVKYTVRSTVNASAAFSRMTNVRDNEAALRSNQDYSIMTLFGYDEEKLNPEIRLCCKRVKAFDTWGMKWSNYSSFHKRQQPGVKKALQDIKSMFWEYWALVCSVMDKVEYNRVKNVNLVDLSMDYADEPHIKRLPRLMCIAEMCSLPWLFDKPIKVVEGKVKWEWAKYLKVPRQFVSLGDKAILFYADLPRLFKQSMDKYIYVGGGFIRFVKESSQETMDEFADHLYRFHSQQPSIYGAHSSDAGQRPDYYAYLHSDDSHFTFKTVYKGVPSIISVDADIKKCDLSHGPGLFALLLYVIVHAGFDFVHVSGLFLQLMTNVMIRHPNPKVSHFAIFKLNCIMLFTGSVLTTLVNNIACLLILMAFRVVTKDAIITDEDQLRLILSQAASLVGYEVSLDTITITVIGEEPDLTRMMFLKHFVAMSHRGPVAAKCLSTLIRGIGISDDECETLPRMQEIVNGWCNHHDSLILTTIFESVGLTKTSTYESCVTIYNESYELRYGVSTVDLLEGLRMLFETRQAVLVAHPALDAIQRVGYGLPRVG